MGEPSRETPTRSSRIAVCAAEAETRTQLEATLVLGSHEIVVSTDSLNELIDSARSLDPQVVVLSCGVDPFTYLRDIARLRAELAGVPLVVVAARFVPRTARKLITGHADGLLHDPDVPRALVATVNAVLARQLCVPAELRGRLAQPVFTHREKQVLELVAGGLTNGEIASHLFLSESTVKSHLASSFRKLGVSSRTEAAQLLLDRDFCLQPTGELTPGTSAGTPISLR